MIAVDEDALICDLAETYQIFDYRRLPLTRVAVFACGLGTNSRIMMRLSDQRVPIDTLLLAQVVDGVQLLVWSRTQDGQQGKNQPRSIARALIGADKPAKKNNEVAFESGEDFDKARRRLLGQGGISQWQQS